MGYGKVLMAATSRTLIIRVDPLCIFYSTYLCDSMSQSIDPVMEGSGTICESGKSRYCVMAGICFWASRKETEQRACQRTENGWPMLLTLMLEVMVMNPWKCSVPDIVLMRNTYSYVTRRSEPAALLILASTPSLVGNPQSNSPEEREGRTPPFPNRYHYNFWASAQRFV